LQNEVVNIASDPNLEDQISVFISLSDRVTQLYTQALRSLFVAFYESQGYSAGTLTHLSMGRWEDL
jgi:hypothetical protein